MDQFLKMDIFFVVATIAVVIVTGLVAFAIFRVLRILRHVERISETVSGEAELIRSDIDDLRSRVKEEGFKIAHLARFARNSFKRYVKRKVTK